MTVNLAFPQIFMSIFQVEDFVLKRNKVISGMSSEWRNMYHRAKQADVYLD